MNEVGTYDPDLEMYRQPAREPDLATIRFLRWLAEQGRFGHRPAGPPAGSLAEGLATGRQRIRAAWQWSLQPRPPVSPR